MLRAKSMALLALSQQGDNFGYYDEEADSRLRMDEYMTLKI